MGVAGGESKRFLCDDPPPPNQQENLFSAPTAASAVSTADSRQQFNLRVCTQSSLSSVLLHLQTRNMATTFTHCSQSASIHPAACISHHAVVEIIKVFFLSVFIFCSSLSKTTVAMKCQSQSQNENTTAKHNILSHCHQTPKPLTVYNCLLQ